MCPGKQQFTDGELKDKTFSDVHSGSILVSTMQYLFGELYDQLVVDWTGFPLLDQSAGVVVCAILSVHEVSVL